MNEHSYEKGSFLKGGKQKFECSVRLRDMPTDLKIVNIEAPSKEEALTLLQKQGYLVISIMDQAEKEAKAQGGAVEGKKATLKKTPLKRISGKGLNVLFAGSVSTREIIFFAVQLSTLLNAGIALLRALDIIRKGTANTYFQKVIGTLTVNVSEGSPLSLGMKQFPKVFPWVWVNMVEVGEATGKLPEVLKEVSRFQESSQRIKSKVISAFVYPIFLIVAATAALTYILIAIVPKFEEIFQAQGMSLPVLTKGVIFASGVIRHHFLLVFVTLVAAVWAVGIFRKTSGGRFFFDQIYLKTPIFGPLLLEVAAVRFARGLATLLKAGVQILQGLDIAGKLTQNAAIQYKIKNVREAVGSGQGLGDQLEKRKTFPVFMTQLIKVGEESGELDRFLDLVANFYEERVDTFLGRMTTLIEPMLLLIMGAIIGTIVISLFLPIIEISTGGV